MAWRRQSANRLDQGLYSLTALPEVLEHLLELLLWAKVGAVVHPEGAGAKAAHQLGEKVVLALELGIEGGAAHARPGEDVRHGDLGVVPLKKQLGEGLLYGKAAAALAGVHQASASTAAASTARKTSWNEAPVHSHAATTEPYSG